MAPNQKEELFQRLKTLQNNISGLQLEWCNRIEVSNAKAQLPGLMPHNHEASKNSQFKSLTEQELEANLFNSDSPVSKARRQLADNELMLYFDKCKIILERITQEIKQKLLEDAIVLEEAKEKDADKKQKEEALFSNYIIEQQELHKKILADIEKIKLLISEIEKQQEILYFMMDTSINNITIALNSAIKDALEDFKLPSSDDPATEFLNTIIKDNKSELQNIGRAINKDFLMKDNVNFEKTMNKVEDEFSAFLKRKVEANPSRHKYPNINDRIQEAAAAFRSKMLAMAPELKETITTNLGNIKVEKSKFYQLDADKGIIQQQLEICNDSQKQSAKNSKAYAIKNISENNNILIKNVAADIAIGYQVENKITSARDRMKAAREKKKGLSDSIHEAKEAPNNSRKPEPAIIQQDEPAVDRKAPAHIRPRNR